MLTTYAAERTRCRGESKAIGASFPKDGVRFRSDREAFSAGGYSPGVLCAGSFPYRVTCVTRSRWAHSRAGCFSGFDSRRSVKMYSIVMLVAMSSGGEVADCHRKH